MREEDLLEQLEKLIELREYIKDAKSTLLGASLHSNLMSSELMKKGDKDLSADLRIIKDEIDEILLETNNKFRLIESWITDTKNKMLGKLKEVL